MKSYSLLIAGAIFLAACNGSVKTDSKDNTNEAAATETSAQTSPENKIAKVADPVCGMEKESTWTDNIAKGTDTMWFCSPHCKETYEKNPAKYPEKKEETPKS